MTSETCLVEQWTPLSITLQQRYDALPSPQCTDITYIYAFMHKMLLMTIYDAEIRNILCHLREAISNLDHIYVSLLIGTVILPGQTNIFMYIYVHIMLSYMYVCISFA